MVGKRGSSPSASERPSKRQALSSPEEGELDDKTATPSGPPLTPDKSDKYRPKHAFPFKKRSRSRSPSPSKHRLPARPSPRRDEDYKHDRNYRRGPDRYVPDYDVRRDPPDVRDSYDHRRGGYDSWTPNDTWGHDTRGGRYPPARDAYDSRGDRYDARRHNRPKSPPRRQRSTSYRPSSPPPPVFVPRQPPPPAIPPPPATPPPPPPESLPNLREGVKFSISKRVDEMPRIPPEAHVTNETEKDAEAPAKDRQDMPPSEPPAVSELPRQDTPKKPRRVPVKRTVSQERLAYDRVFIGCGRMDAYDVTTKVGEGTFGEVHKATYRPTSTAVALKRILMHNEKEGMPITALREIRILKRLNHPNVVQLREVIVQGSPPTFHMVFPYMDHDLAGLLENERVQMNPSQIKLYMRQLLEGTAYLHANNIVHRDMKAANLLISNTGLLQIADFGLARAFDPRAALVARRNGDNPQDAPRYTNCVVTRWYRPPELFLGARRYGGEIDLWGIGCVLGEIFNRRPILMGTSDANQLDLIWQLCGSPSRDNWPDFDSLPGLDGVKRWNRYERKVAPRFEGAGKETADLLDKLLIIDPSRRITAAAALDHDWFWTDPMPADPKTLPKYESSHEFDKRSRRQLPAPAAPPIMAMPHTLPPPLHNNPHFHHPPPPLQMQQQQQQQPTNGWRPGWSGPGGGSRGPPHRGGYGPGRGYGPGPGPGPGPGHGYEPYRGPPHHHHPHQHPPYGPRHAPGYDTYRPPPHSQPPAAAAAAAAAAGTHGLPQKPRVDSFPAERERERDRRAAPLPYD